MPNKITLKNRARKFTKKGLPECSFSSLSLFHNRDQNPFDWRSELAGPWFLIEIGRELVGP